MLVGEKMNIGLMLHNLSQISIPIIIVSIVLYRTPEINFRALLLTAIIGAYIPDIDHLNIWNKVPHKGFFSFVKFCLRSDRYRKSFLLFHNHLTMLIILITLPIAVFINLFVGIFLLTFLTHLILDYLADMFLIKAHSHWKFRSWI